MNHEERHNDIHSIGTMQGMPPGRTVHHVGVLDLRGIPAEQIMRINEMHTVDVLLLSEETKLALSQASVHHVGSIVIADPEERVFVTPQLEISCSGLEEMPSGQKFLLVGNLFFRPDVPPQLVAEKIGSVRVVGVLIACQGVYGALLGKMQLINGASVILPDDVGPLARDTGETWISREYLFDLPDGTTYINLGKTRIYEDVSQELPLLRQKIAAYYNVGETKGPAPLLATLQARCPVNLGKFVVE
jgi:hypothetical protein